MSSESFPVVDVAAREFWVLLILALLVLTPLTRARPRAWALAALNVLFLTALLREAVVTALFGVLAVSALLRLVAKGRGAGALLVGAGVAGGLLFVVHKLPGLAAELGVGGLNPLLAGVGFSYVLLRLVELFRAVREGRHPPPDIVSTVNYLLPFHMLAAGPFQAYDDFVKAPPVPAAPTFTTALEGAERIVTGLFKKFVVAFVLERLMLTGFRADGWYFLLEAQLYFLWVYLDFSAYSDIAVGVGRLLGIATPENFNRPYLARNLMDFWERWHISLSQWIRRNLFIPLQLALDRRSATRRPLLWASLAFTISFLLCGAWHGLSWRFVAWGGAHALGLVVANLYKHWLQKRIGRAGVKNYMERPVLRAAATVVTYEFVAFSLVIVGYPFGEGS